MLNNKKCDYKNLCKVTNNTTLETQLTTVEDIINPFVLNPYLNLSDGLYETNIPDYLQFCKYINENMRGGGKLLYKRCQDNKASMYVIKRKGYYGFFVVNMNEGSSKGISIVNGGMTKKITKSVDLQWLFDSFEIVLSKYLNILSPLRLKQEELSSELQELGLSGSIHGCIVDIDFYHHIMLNPIDGTMTYYYSSTFGMVEPLSSFEKVLVSIKKHNRGLLALSKKDYKKLLSKFNKLNKSPDYLLGKASNYYLLDSSSENNIDGLDNKEQIVSRSDGMYYISRQISPLQRLFSGHTLRSFDLKLVESPPIIESNNKTTKDDKSIIKDNNIKKDINNTIPIKDNNYKNEAVESNIKKDTNNTITIKDNNYKDETVESNNEVFIILYLIIIYLIIIFIF